MRPTRARRKLDCDVAGLGLRIGSQVGATSGNGSLQGFAGPVASDLRDGRTATRPLIRLQQFTNDPAECRRVGNETFCY